MYLWLEQADTVGRGSTSVKCEWVEQTAGLFVCGERIKPLKTAWSLTLDSYLLGTL